MAALGIEITPDHSETVHGARDGSDPDGAGSGDRGDAGPLSDATSVLELLRSGDRDAVFRGLVPGREPQVGSPAGGTDAWSDAQAAPTLEGVFKGATTTVVAQLPEDPLHGDYERMLRSGIKPSLAKLTLARKIAATVLSMWKHQEVYDPKRHHFVGSGVAALSEAEGIGGESGVAARERFEGEHPLVSWSAGREGKTRDAGYVPSECRPKRWPRKALSGAWRPRLTGGGDQGFEIGGEDVRNPSSSTFAGVTWTASFAGSGASTTSALVGASTRPLREAARAVGCIILLTTHFSGVAFAGLGAWLHLAQQQDCGDPLAPPRGHHGRYYTYEPACCCPGWWKEHSPGADRDLGRSSRGRRDVPAARIAETSASAKRHAR